jgi:hypothetical protein
VHFLYIVIYIYIKLKRDKCLLLDSGPMNEFGPDVVSFSEHDKIGVMLCVYLL